MTRPTAMAPDASTSPVDWLGELEAVHKDGRVVPVQLSCGPDSDGVYKIRDALEPTHGQAQFFKSDGTQEWTLSDKLGGGRPWRIRNVQPTTPERDPALWDRMEALVRRMAAITKPVSVLGGGSVDLMFQYEQTVGAACVEARAIVADLPKPVDPDLLEVRRIVAEALTSQGTKDNVLAGDFDGTPSITAPLACLKRGRQLAGEQA